MLANYTFSKDINIFIISFFLTFHVCWNLQQYLFQGKHCAHLPFFLTLNINTIFVLMPF